MKDLHTNSKLQGSSWSNREENKCCIINKQYLSVCVVMSTH